MTRVAALLLVGCTAAVPEPLAQSTPPVVTRHVITTNCRDTRFVSTLHQWREEKTQFTHLQCVGKRRGAEREIIDMGE